MTDLELDLYVRSSSAQEQYDSVVDKLESLDEKGEIEGYNTYDWADEIQLRAKNGDSEGCNFALDKFEEFENWANEHGKSIRPCFDIREYDSSFTNEKRKVVVLPVMAIAGYEGDELKAVYPCFDGNEYLNVHDFLSMVEEGKFDISETTEEEKHEVKKQVEKNVEEHEDEVQEEQEQEQMTVDN
ncbi:MAG: HTH domain-containing protein [Halobacteria archaeon]|nr:HTH domain-containing protein [Halobacteria archaeon]